MPQWAATQSYPREQITNVKVDSIVPILRVKRAVSTMSLAT